MTVTLLTKNLSDTGPGVVVTPSLSISASTTGRHTQLWDSSDGVGIGELVRYRFKLPSSGTFGAHWVLVRMLDEVWFDDVRANPVTPPPP